MIEPAREHRDDMRVGERTARYPVLGETSAARVAQAAGLDLLADERRREVALRVAGRRVAAPHDIAALVEADGEPHLRVVALAERPPALLGARPADVRGTLPVTPFAAHADLREDRGEAVVGGVVVLAHAGRVTLRTHEIPVLVQPGPVQDVVVLDLLVGIEVEPALAALVLRTAVPGERQRLQPAVGKLDEILLQRIDAEGVLHLEGGELAVRPVGLDQEFSVPAEEAGMHAVMVEARVVEIAEHGLVGRVLHGEPVLRCAPQLRLGAVAAGAGLAADEGGCRNRGRAAGQELKCQSARDDDRRRDARCDDDGTPRNVPRLRIALSGPCPVATPRRGGRALRSALLLGRLFGPGHESSPDARWIVTGYTCAWRRPAPACIRCDCPVHRGAWRARGWPRMPLAPAARRA